MASDHQAFGWCQLQDLRRAQVSFGQRLVNAESFAGQHRVPGQPVPARGVDHQAIGQQRESRHDVALSQRA